MHAYHVGVCPCWWWCTVSVTKKTSPSALASTINSQTPKVVQSIHIQLQQCHESISSLSGITLLPVPGQENTADLCHMPVPALVEDATWQNLWSRLNAFPVLWSMIAIDSLIKYWTSLFPRPSLMWLIKNCIPQHDTVQLFTAITSPPPYTRLVYS